MSSTSYKNYDKRKYEENKEKGICTKCWKRPVKEGHKTRCKECNEKQRIWRRQHYLNNKQRYIESRIEWRKANLEAGRCVTCGREILFPGKRKSCITCASNFWEEFRWS